MQITTLCRPPDDERRFADCNTMRQIQLMDFIDRLLALSRQIGWDPIDIYFLHIFFAVVLSHLVPLLLYYSFRGIRFLFRWLRSHRKGKS